MLVAIQHQRYVHKSFLPFQMFSHYLINIPNQVSWRRENYAVLPTGGSQYRGNILTIPSVNKNDRGTYYCVAENGVGKGKRRNIAVEVEFSPVITVPRYIKIN